MRNVRWISAFIFLALMSAGLIMALAEMTLLLTIIKEM